MQAPLSASVPNWLQELKKYNEWRFSLPEGNQWVFSIPESSQSDSMFFRLPRELRDMILEITLMQEFVDGSRDKTSHSRSRGLPYGFRWKLFPEPLNTYNALLRTCQRLHHEARRIPWTLWDVVAFLKPYEGAFKHFYTLTNARLVAGGERYAAPVGKHSALLSAADVAKHNSRSVRIAAHWDYIDSGNNLQKGLDSSALLKPSRIIIRVRHTDWYGWKSNTALSFQAQIVNIRRFPDCITEIALELETLERKTDQLTAIADRMRQHWRFCKYDGSLLSADTNDQNYDTTRWTGSSFIEDRRWIRDESAPGEIDYHVLTVKFPIAVVRPSAVTEQKCPDIWLENDQFSQILWTGPASVHIRDLDDVCMPLTTQARDVDALLHRFWRKCHCAPRQRKCCRNPTFLAVGSSFRDENTPNNPFCQACQAQGCTEEKRGRTQRR